MVHRHRALGGLYGALIGDALGVPYEFRLAHELPEDAALEMVPSPGWRCTYAGVPPGTWSDDGALLLCLAASLGRCGELDLEDLSKRMVSWWRRGAYTPDGRVFDIGNRTSASLSAIEQGVPPERAGGTSEQANGNGSLMRVLPLAVWHRGSDEELIRDATRQSLPTHAHPRSSLSCALYCLWVRGLLRGTEDAWDQAVATLSGLQPHPELEHVLADRPLRGSGYVLDSLHAARHLVEGSGSYEEAVRAAVKLGEDTDTTACITGGAAGVRWGLDGVPERWLSALRGREVCDPLFDALLAG
jgi:ADP-ribosyl-[dinitrogen reductase] hydrolase